MPRIFTNDPNDTFSFDYSTIPANLLYGRLHFHLTVTSFAVGFLNWPFSSILHTDETLDAIELAP